MKFLSFALAAASGLLASSPVLAADVVQQCSKANFVAPAYIEGPHNEFSIDLLASLKKLDVKVTFFVLGMALQEPQGQAAVRQLAKDGHLIGSMGFTNRPSETLSQDELYMEITFTSDFISGLVGGNGRPKYFYCPGGTCGPKTLKVLKALELIPVQASSAATDLQDSNPANQKNEYYSDVYNKGLTSSSNSIFVQRDTIKSSVTAASTFIPIIKSKGKTVATVAGCLGDAEPYYSEEQWAKILMKYEENNQPTPLPTDAPTPDGPPSPTPSPTPSSSPTPSPSPPVQGTCSDPQWGVDFVGNDIRSVVQPNPELCCVECAATPGCRAHTWSAYNGGTCWLKSKVTDMKEMAGTVSAFIQNTEEGVCTDIVDGVDFYGNDIRNTPQKEAANCCADCLATPGCTAWTWSTYNGGTCWLKSAATVNPASAPCPSCRSAKVNPSSCKLLMGTDFFGNDIFNRPVAKADHCCTVCKASSDCKAFSWNGFNGGTCWFKSDKGSPTNSGQVISGAL